MHIVQYCTCTVYNYREWGGGCHIDKRWGRKGHMIISIDFYTNWRTISTNSAHPFFVHFNNSGLVKGCSQKINTYEV